MANDLRTLVDPQRAAVQRQVIIPRVAPLHVGVEAVIGGAALVLIPQALLRRLLPFAVDLDNALGPERHIRMNENLQAVGLVPQDVVGTAADNDAGAFLRKLRNDLILMIPEDILVGGPPLPNSRLMVMTLFFIYVSPFNGTELVSERSR